jgi:hypothetical protein
VTRHPAPPSWATSANQRSALSIVQRLAPASSEAGATFRCSLNGAAFSACTSPASINASKGRNTFTVVAKDAAANVDDSPATYSWAFEKKKKKKK